MLRWGLRISRLSFIEYLDIIETMVLEEIALPFSIDKALKEIQLNAENALTPADEWGETAAAEEAQDAMMERFPSALPERFLDE